MLNSPDRGAPPNPRADRQFLDDLAGAADDAALDRLRARLAEQAEADGLLDVAYRTMDSPIGPLLLAATPAGLVRVAFERENHDDVLVELSTAISPRILRSSRQVDDVARQIDEYFAGRRRLFEVPVDLQLSKGFRRAVLTHLLEIPYGARESYTVVARSAGNPRAVRAAGSACATNPIPLVVPCHRVVRSDGTYGQYRGGPEAKHLLLTMESGR
ncbi:MAG TPA: methylated-DNA--[protein]-cysteine S-methyltransferase [Acidimicrobiia bacterium]|jgi:methylated-DNA-[protein]-cysteine S-methyltransferase|nr:methylated-DNA--[protein]-cysteine S-methyltransferase [Acidimicrobiia bacterium]